MVRSVNAKLEKIRIQDFPGLERHLNLEMLQYQVEGLSIFTFGSQ